MVYRSNAVRQKSHEPVPCSDHLRHLTNEMCGRVKKIPIEEATFGDMRYDAPFTLGSFCSDGWGESHFYSPARAP